MKLTINSKKLGRALTFSAPGGGYIYVDLNRCEGIMGDQICSGGALRGSTLSYDGRQEDFERVCRSWYKTYMRVNADWI